MKTKFCFTLPLLLTLFTAGAVLAAPLFGHEQVQKALDEELLSYYEAILYVNKAEHGVTAQTMRVFSRSIDFPFRWSEAGRFAISTGRRRPKDSLRLPIGVFNIDPQRVYQKTFSKIDGMLLSYAMFLDAKSGDEKFDIAIYGVPSLDALKRQRPRSGFVHGIALSNRFAEPLFDRVTRQIQGDVPEIESREVDSSNASLVVLLKRDAKSRVILKKGFKALVVIVDVED